ncbi:carboxymuconolactone decarboxylase family protein [Mycolicibacterium diernhoferi]|uniref:Carboxymuconolactone decarboxylase n=1 Tax=Mycolicibacterium diernhoferi TaxID=1801 RepID=A0A1Q4H6F0_9MYCO|nr:carboxymuconolactone decarboxylase family protein [Mycolicibacterium diernhoferi]OJZ63130.1 carboxymuconolactone decarboxylase [Mycolicibacterium diernhoferi]OPE47290.1 carboxymuconolactone decarboxylase [Mycolicibacterium diernhoferi]PEG53190.1 carboxymuconolactone decarboxylase family protein [Mycolicibacterium diernhoferi]QYL21905.1 carboxymuconolactone decarboxylase family protein [Mycolicibacterium diernhoferi]
MTRVEPLRTKHWPPQMRDALAAMNPPVRRHPPLPTEGRPKGLNVLGAMAYHPELSRAFFTFNGHLLGATTLTPRQRELLVLRTAVLRESEYEWAQHVVIAGDVGISGEEVAEIEVGPQSPIWSDADAALLRTADELVGDGVIGEATWATLTQHLDTQQILDAIFTVGAYETLGWMLRSFGVELDEDVRTYLAEKGFGQAIKPS